MSTLNEHGELQLQNDGTEPHSTPIKKLSLVRDTVAVYRVRSSLRTGASAASFGTKGSRGCVGIASGEGSSNVQQPQ
jgi:hypothetical protein